VNIAAKKAEFEKLSDAEKKHAYGKYGSTWNLFIFIMFFSIFIGGGLFFIGMGLISMLASFIAIALGWTTVTFAEFFVDFPWLEFAVLSFLGFGGIFGLIFGLIMAGLTNLLRK